MADELWIVSDKEPAGWTVDAEGKVGTNKKYNLGSGRISIAVPDAPLTEKQAKAIRKLIGKLRADGVLQHNPKVGVLYPQKSTVANVGQSLNYIRCWQDDCDEELRTTADAGVSKGVKWVEPAMVEPPDQSVHQDTQAQHASLTAARDERRASEPAAGVTQDQPSEDSLEGGEDVPGQVVLSEGMEGVEVAAWQAVVNEVLATDTNSEEELLTADGVFGPVTVNATMTVQSILGVPPSGVVDGDTWVAVI